MRFLPSEPHTWSRLERFLWIGIFYIWVISLVVAFWPSDSKAATPVVQRQTSVSPSPTATSTHVPTVLPTKPPEPWTYTIVAGDTPASIEAKTGVTWSVLLYINSVEIEAAAHERGLPSSNQGQFLYPGVILELPPT